MRNRRPLELSSVCVVKAARAEIKEAARAATNAAEVPSDQYETLERLLKGRYRSSQVR
jgi:hypothetical protein